MAQPHLRPRHFVKILQSADQVRPGIRQPEWLAPLLDDLCDCIEPIKGEARVGYDVKFLDPLWQINLFLGRTEIVGGMRDGVSDYVNFTANIPRILGLFGTVDRCEWLALPHALDGNRTESASGLFVEAIWQDKQIQLALHSVPPSDSAPGLRQYPDGSYELA